MCAHVEMCFVQGHCHYATAIRGQMAFSDGWKYSRGGMVFRSPACSLRLAREIEHRFAERQEPIGVSLDLRDPELCRGALHEPVETVEKP
jgi:hypothetical protein